MREEAAMSRPAAEPDAVARLEPWERRLLNRLQDGIPLVERPFAAVAAELGLDEAQVLAAIERFLAAGLLTRFGPLFDATTLGGGVLLAAMAVPPEQIASVVHLVSSAVPDLGPNQISLVTTDGEMLHRPAPEGDDGLAQGPLGQDQLSRQRAFEKALEEQA